MIGFRRGYDNASDFRKLGCNIWDANANENDDWLNNPNRQGTDDLGRIYGVQARDWIGPSGSIDQLKNIVQDLSKGIDNRREIVTHWNPGEMDQMALPSCHLLYQFGIQGGRLNLSMYQRSCDFFLGVPFNIVGYSWLLHVVARITGLRPGIFTHFMHDCHLYVDHLDGAKEMLMRDEKRLPRMVINPAVVDRNYLENMATVDDFVLNVYEYHPANKGKMAV